MKIESPNLDARDLSVALVASRFNHLISIRLIEGARTSLLERGIEVSEVDEQPWGRFVFFSDPDGNRWALQELPKCAAGAGGDGDWEAAGVDPNA